MSLNFKLVITVALLAGCAAPQGNALRAEAEVNAAVPPAQPAGPISRFDGVYAGPITATTGTYSCPNALTGNRAMRVQDGRVWLDMSPSRGAPLQGRVQEDGGVRANDRIDRAIAVNGQIINEQFVGGWTRGRCVYNLNFRRIG